MIGMLYAFADRHATEIYVLVSIVLAFAIVLGARLLAYEPG